MKSFVRWCVLFCTAVAFAACASSDSSGAPEAIEAYYTALINKDTDGVINASCAAWEESAKQDVDSFAAVTPALEGLACTQSGTDPDGALVTCQGVIKVTYNNEQQELPLEGRTYLAVEEGGEWRMCGYK
jgi:hypothetical protein